jgi:hypothetical protein
MELYLGQPSDPRSLSISSGIHMIVHNKSDKVVFLDGFSISAGTQANVAISRSYTNLLEKPYSECVKDVGSNPSNSTLAVLNTNYRHGLFFLIKKQT